MPICLLSDIFTKSQAQYKHYSWHLGANVCFLKINSGKSPGSSRKDKPALGDYTGENYRNTMITPGLLQKISWYMEDKFARVKVL